MGLLCCFFHLSKNGASAFRSVTTAGNMESIRQFQRYSTKKTVIL